MINNIQDIRLKGGISFMLGGDLLGKNPKAQKAHPPLPLSAQQKNNQMVNWYRA